MRPIIKSTKHYVQMSLSTIAAGARLTVILAEGVDIVDKNDPDEVEEGAVLKACYVELWTQQDGNDGSEVIILAKEMEAGIGPSTTEMAALSDYNNKKNILFTHQGLASNESIGNPIPIMRGWYKIPKSKQRFGLGDKLNLTLFNPSANVLTFCGFATYKEYT